VVQSDCTNCFIMKMRIKIDNNNNNNNNNVATQIPWKRGRCLAWDATCSNTYAQSYVQANSRKAGSAATAAELKKLQKYQDIFASVDFIPVVIESSGVLGSACHGTGLGDWTPAFRSQPRTTLNIVRVSAARCSYLTRQCLLYYWDIAVQQFNEQAVA